MQERNNDFSQNKPDTRRANVSRPH